MASMRAMAAACMIMSGRSASARGSSRSSKPAPSVAGRVGSRSAPAISEWTVLGRRQARSKPALPGSLPSPAPAGGSMAGGASGRAKP